jgi:hypothetical protein
MKSCFIVENELLEIRVIPFYSRLTIGRQSTNDIAIPDRTVSKQHAKVGRVKGQIVVKDLGSRNGTFVNGQKVEKSILSSGDRVKVGGVSLRFFKDKEDSDNKSAGGDPDLAWRQRLGDYLMEAGLVDDMILTRALADEEKIKTIDQFLLDTGVLNDQSMAKALAKQMKLPFIRLNELEIPWEAIYLVPVEVAKSRLLVPVKLSEGKLLVAMFNPLDVEGIRVLRMTTKKSIVVTVAARGDILEALEKYYPAEILDPMLNGAPDEDHITVEI